jgi:hypothetical protein
MALQYDITVISSTPNLAAKIILNCFYPIKSNLIRVEATLAGTEFLKRCGEVGFPRDIYPVSPFAKQHLILSGYRLTKRNTI